MGYVGMKYKHFYRDKKAWKSMHLCLIMSLKWAAMTLG